MMNRARSIKDIGNIYLQMKQAASTINEAAEAAKKSQKVKAKMPKDTFPKAGEKAKEPSTLKKSGPSNVKGLKKAKGNKKFSQKTKKIRESSINSFMSIFDKLYEDVMQNDELELNKGVNMGPEGDLGDEDADLGADDLGGDLGDETPESPKELLEQAIELLQKAVEALGSEDSDSDSEDLEDLGVDTDEEGDEEEPEDEDNEEYYDDEDEMYETTEIEKLPDSAGHKLTKGNEVGGHIKASKGKADAKVTDEVGTETGKEPLAHKSELTNPSKNKVGGLKAGKSLFDQ